MSVFGVLLECGGWWLGLFISRGYFCVLWVRGCVCLYVILGFRVGRNVKGFCSFCVDVIEFCLGLLWINVFIWGIWWSVFFVDILVGMLLIIEREWLNVGIGYYRDGFSYRLYFF